MNSIAEKYTEIAPLGQTRGRRTALVAITCLLVLGLLTACSRRPPNTLGPLGASGALSTHSVQPAPTGATEGGQVGFFLDVSGTVTVHQAGGSGNQPSGASSGAGETSVPLPPRVGDPIYAPDTIQTEAGSTAQFQLGDNALIRLDASSAVEIPTFPRIAPGEKIPSLVVIVREGTVLFSVARQSPGSALLAAAEDFVVETRAADFLIARTDKGTEVAVGRGEVQIGPYPSADRATSASGPAPTQGVTAEEFIKAGVGARPAELASGYQVSIPSTTSGSALPPLSPRPLSDSNRSLLRPSEKSSTAQERGMEPEGGAESAPTPPTPPQEPAPPKL